MTRKYSRTIAAMAIALLSGGLVSPLPAASSTSGMQFAEQWKYQVPAEANPNIGLQGGLVLNPSARTGFQIFNLTGFRLFIRVFDLDSGKIRAEKIHTGFEVSPTRNQSITTVMHGLDEENNTLYLPIVEPIRRPDGSSTKPALGNFTGVRGFSGTNASEVFKMDRLTAYDPSRILLSQNPPDGPEDVETCASAACLPQTFGVLPSLMGMEFVPSHVAGGYPKLLMQFTEASGPGMERNLMTNWLSQWDIKTRLQDFNYRLQSCTVQPPSGRGDQPYSVFQARLGGGIFLGCNGQGSIGQAVRVVIDATTNQPGGESTFPGPINAVDILSDKEGDRIVFRVFDPTGETYWVWSGQAGAYQGIVSATISGVATSTVINPKTGRLYVMADSSQKGNQIRPASLMTTDLRRAPTPQMTYHTDMFIPQVDYAPVIDTGADGTSARLWFHVSGTTEYQIIEDNVPPSFDEPLSDLDQYTADVEEQEGVTAASYTGTGHGYGFRSLLAGGIRGMFPIGFDVSASTARNLVLQYVHSPCQTGDREVRLGSVPFANLSNGLTSAEAAALSSEPGTVADVREPSGRCHPHVAPNTLPEPPRPLPDDPDEDGKSQLDESLGTDWPFFPAQCSGNSEDEKVTALKPLDRDPVPEQGVETGIPETGTQADPVIGEAKSATGNPRGTRVPLEDNRATVRCSQTEAQVEASADSGALTMDSVAEQIGPIHVGAVGSSTNLYRDPNRGLVARTVSYVRDVKIGAHISIDAAYSMAEAWAGGRPGTAGTKLDRFICGVSIPGIAGRVDVLPVDSPVGSLPPDTDPIVLGDPLYDATKDVPNPVDGGTGFSQPLPDLDATDFGADDRTIPGGLALCGEAKDGVPQAGGTVLGQRPFLELLNRALGSRGRASMPEPDRDLRQGSFGGYIASIQKDRFEQISSRTVSNDGSTEVPALELQIFQDDPIMGRGRQLFQFAGVDASVTYGIYLLNPAFEPVDDPNDGLPPFDPTDDLIDFTGGPTLPPLDYGDPTPPSLPPSGGVFEPVRYLYRGISFLGRSWQDAALVGSIIMLLAGPLVLIARRRALRTLA